MSPALIGAAIGAAFGLVNFFILQSLSDRMAREADTKDNNSQVPKILKTVAWIDLFIFPVAGWFIGPLVAS
jgi:hypothetical protein